VKHRPGYDNTSKNHILLAGGVGILWSGSAYEKNIMEQIGGLLERMNAALYWVDGNHENFDMLRRYSVRQNTGMRPILKRIFHLPRGGCYSIGRYSVFAFGGALSVDRDAQNPNGGWWAEELPSQNEIERGFQMLKKAKHVDIILTHAAPTSILPELHLVGDLPESKKGVDDPVPAVLEQYRLVLKRRWPQAFWYFGHYHKDITISLECRGLYEDVVCHDEEIAALMATKGGYGGDRSNA
jgi:hypothetical protein